MRCRACRQRKKMPSLRHGGDLSGRGKSRDLSPAVPAVSGCSPRGRVEKRRAVRSDGAVPASLLPLSYLRHQDKRRRCVVGLCLRRNTAHICYVGASGVVPPPESGHIRAD